MIPTYLKSQQATNLVWPSRILTQVQVSELQSLKVLSPEVDAKNFPVGPNLTDMTELPWPSSDLQNGIFTMSTLVTYLGCK